MAQNNAINTPRSTLSISPNDTRAVSMSAEMGSTLSSSGRSFLGSSGASFLSFGGTNPDDDEAGFQFVVPEDYLTGGRVTIIFITAAAGGDTVQFEVDITVAAVGEDTSTVTESIAAQNIAGSATSWFSVSLGPFVAATATFAVGDMVFVKVHRDASDAGDTYGSDAYINLMKFEYNY